MKKAIGNAGLAAVISIGLLAAFPVIAWAAPVLPVGISIGSQSLAGMTAEEARSAVEQYVNGLAGQKVILNVDGQDVETTAGELGFHWSNTDAVDQAASQYAGAASSDNIWSRRIWRPRPWIWNWTRKWIPQR